MSETLFEVDITRYPTMCAECNTLDPRVIEAITDMQCIHCGTQEKWKRNPHFRHEPYEDPYTEETFESFAGQVAVIFGVAWTFLRSQCRYDADGNMVIPRPLLEEIITRVETDYSKMQETEKELYRHMVNVFLKHPIRKATSGLKIPDPQGVGG